MPNSGRQSGEQNSRILRHAAADANVASSPSDDEGYGSVPRIKGAVFVMIFLPLRLYYFKHVIFG